ncbi:hypothetical protein MNBD_BACTEROID05-317, partial [hydrothermal vent metagenome]
MFPLIPSKTNKSVSNITAEIASEVQSLGSGINPFVLKSLEEFMLPL